MDYITINGRRINLTKEQSEEIRRSYLREKIKVCDLKNGDTFKLCGLEFIKFPPHEGRVPAVIKNPVGSSSFGACSDFGKARHISDELNRILQNITNAVGKENFVTTLNIESHSVDLKALDGTAYQPVRSYISIPTLDFYRKNREYFDMHKIDVAWWLATADSVGSNLVLCVLPKGDIRLKHSTHDDAWVRPIIYLASCTEVE